MAINTSNFYGKDAQQTLKDKVLPYIVDQVRKDNPFLAIALDKTEAFSGKQYRVAIKFKDTGQGGSYSGLDTYKINKIDTRDAMLFDPKFYYQSVVLEETEVSMSQTAGNVIDLTLSKIEEAAQEMAEGIGNLVHGDGAGNGGKDFHGLIAGCDNGTLVTTYGGLDRTAGAGTSGESVKGNLNNTDYTTGGTKFSLAVLQTMIDNCSNGNMMPDLALCSKEVFNIVRALMPAATMNRSPGSASDIQRDGGRVPAQIAYAGYQKIFYQGIPFVKDPLMNETNGAAGGAAEDYMFILNTDTWTFPLVDMAKADIKKVTNQYLTGGYDVTGVNTAAWKGFYMNDFVRPTNQGAWIAQIKFGGNLICKMPRYNGIFTSING